ncbi:hypothetical protein ACQP3J_32415, partial [Escherichia coli]
GLNPQWGCGRHLETAFAKKHQLFTWPNQYQQELKEGQTSFRVRTVTYHAEAVSFVEQVIL